MASKLAGFKRGDIGEDGVYVRDGKPYIGVRTVKKADGWDFTGVCAETEAMGLLNAATQNNSPDITDRSVRSVARASQVYTAAGVTTADLGGAVLAMPTEYGTVGLASDQIQVALQRGVLEPRVVVHPFAYMAYGPAEIGKINRIIIGWKGDEYSDPGDSPEKGSDITSLSLKGVSAQMGGKAPEGLPANRFFMGAWKIIYDGSNQGYTGYFKTPGYYDPEYGGYEKGYNGMPNATTFSKEVLEKTIDIYHAANQSVEVHTNGSWAAEDYVTALEKAVAAHPGITDTRDCAIHGQMMERQHIERLVGDYSKLDATKDMYTELSGTAVGSGSPRRPSGRGTDEETESRQLPLRQPRILLGRPPHGNIHGSRPRQEYESLRLECCLRSAVLRTQRHDGHPYLSAPQYAAQSPAFLPPRLWARAVR